MKLASFSYVFEPTAETQIGESGYLIFVKATSPISPHVCFAVYYDDDAKIWHMSAVPCGDSSIYEASEICSHIFLSRKTDIEELVALKRRKAI